MVVFKVSTDYFKKLNVVGFHHENVWQVKKRIELLEGIPAGTLHLYNNGIELND
jgi:hypothetical protein